MLKLVRFISRSRIKRLAKVRANGRWSVPGASGALAAGWKVNTYIAGTSTAKDTYTDNTEATANANPVILDSRGEATIYWSGTYKIVVTDENDVTIWTEDDYGEGETADPIDSFNKVVNGSFELDAVTTGEPDNWTVVDYSTGVHSLDSTNQISGLKALKFISVGSGGGYATTDYFEVDENKDLTVAFEISSTVADVRNVVDVLWATSAQAAISTVNIYDDSTTNPTNWTSKSGILTPPSSARYAQIRIYGCHSSDATSGTTLYDNIVVTQDVALVSAPNTFVGVNTFTATQKWAKGADVASATALTLGTDGNYFDITGTTAITSITTIGVGTVIKLHFDGILTLTHHATNLILPGGIDIVTVAGDELEFVEYATGDWRLLNQAATEGTWTPTIQDSTNSDAEGQTYGAVTGGIYSKVGNMVFIQGVITATSLGTLTAGDQARIGGLPFTASNLNSIGYSAVHFGFANNLTLGTAGNSVTGLIQDNDNKILLHEWSATTGTGTITIAELSGTVQIMFSGHYAI